MRFVDEYREPEQVMQLIEHLRERASHVYKRQTSLLHRRTPSADYGSVWRSYPRHF